ncbi:heme-copper oxidase subunit III [cyanobiont of Ornithocercus magnificus]|nr:heme-copper oxidase subunit III [cyanobiont of Ornithocercus magnificus]
MEQRALISLTQAEQTESELVVESAEKHGDYRLFGLAIFLAADAMTFAGFFAAYLTFHSVNPLPPGAVYELEMPLPVLNTVLLLVSSATFHRANHWLRCSDMDRCRRLLLLTGALGLAFLTSQMVEYFTLPFGLTDNIYASTFYVVTGFHGLHVTLGAMMILIVWWQARVGDGRVTRGDHFPLEAAELYWHFVDGIWVVLFVILYLI